MRGFIRQGLCGLVFAAALALSACAAPTPEALAANDRFETTNRFIFGLNQGWDHCCLLVAVRRYQAWVPEGGRRGLHNFLGNLNAPVVFANDLLQGEAGRGSQTAGRFLINTTLGLGGFFDPARRMGIADHSEDLGQTFAVWGVREGPYLMLPLLGPSNPRDAVGFAGDILLDPTNFVHFKQHLWWNGARQYAVMLDLRGQTLDALEGIERNSVDYYASLRSLYRQARAEQIRNGRAAPTQDLPDL